MAQLQRVAIAAEQIQGQKILLTKEQRHYLSRVLRLQNGDRFIAMTPVSGWWQSVLQENYGELLEPIALATELPGKITLIAAMPKGSAFEEIVRQTTELGVSAIYPVMSDRTLLKPSAQKIKRWCRIAQEAAEQSERERVPIIFEPISFLDCLSQITDSDLTQGNGKFSVSTQKYICVARGDAPHLLKSLSSNLNPGEHSEIVIATGPEGGWTPAEVEQAIHAGVHPVSLGRRILRAITAPIVALSLVAASLERF